MQVDGSAFVEQLLRECPDVAPVLQAHLRSYDELLLHVFVAAVRRFALAAFEAGDVTRT